MSLLWADKYRPLTFDKLTYNEGLGELLRNLAVGADFPHLLFHGPTGAGKKTRIMCFLREIYGPGVEKLKVTQKSFQVGKQRTKVEVNLVSSAYHVEVNPSECGNKDRFVVQALLKEMASSQQLDTGSNSKGFKVIVIHETDSLTKIAQQGLRRTMEKYMSSCRIILLCNSPSQVIGPLRSRCLHVRVAAPSEDDVIKTINRVCENEALSIPQQFSKRIAQYSDRNLRKALLTLEACKVQSYPFTADDKIPEADWELYIKETASVILANQTPAQLLVVRGRLYELLIHYIPTNIIMKKLVQELSKSVDSTLVPEIIRWAAHYEHQSKLGAKEIYHLEAFVAKFMAIYRKFNIEFYG